MILIFSGSTAVACNTINITALLYRTRSSSASGVVRQKCPRVCLYDRVRRLTAPEDTGPRASVDVTPSSRTPPVSLSQPSVWVCARVCARVYVEEAQCPQTDVARHSPADDDDDDGGDDDDDDDGGLTYCSFRPNPHDIYIYTLHVPRIILVS